MDRSRALRWLAVVISVVAGASCADVTGSSATSPGSARLGPPTGTISMAVAIPSEDAIATAVRWRAGQHDEKEHYESEWIGPGGGKLPLSNADIEIFVPAGALTKWTKISVTALAGKHVAFDMQPHGLVFLKPIQVVFLLKNTAGYGTQAGNAVRSAYLAPSNDQIQTDDSASPAELPAAITYLYGSVAETQVWLLNHFSRWILISGVWTQVK